MDYRLLGFAGAAGALFLSFNCGGSVIAGTGGGSSESTSDSSSNGTFSSSTNTGTQSTGTQSTGTQSTGTQSTTTTVTTTTVSTSSGNVTNCDQICAELQAKGCASDSCLDDCAQAFSGPCVAELSAYVDCFLGFLGPSCEIPQECNAQFDAYEQCQGGGCGPQECGGGGSSGGETFCSCSRSCEGTSYEAICSTSAGQGKCECYANGMLVAQCEEANASCDLDVGCCSQFFFEG
jgi:hypothetical protein